MTKFIFTGFTVQSIYYNFKIFAAVRLMLV